MQVVEVGPLAVEVVKHRHSHLAPHCLGCLACLGQARVTLCHAVIVSAQDDLATWHHPTRHLGHRHQLRRVTSCKHRPSCRLVDTDACRQPLANRHRVAAGLDGKVGAHSGRVLLVPLLPHAIFVLPDALHVHHTLLVVLERHHQRASVAVQSRHRPNTLVLEVAERHLHRLCLCYLGRHLVDGCLGLVHLHLGCLGYLLLHRSRRLLDAHLGALVRTARPLHIWLTSCKVIEHTDHYTTLAGPVVEVDHIPAVLLVGLRHGRNSVVLAIGYHAVRE